MITINDGQCGLCKHFGTDHEQPKLQQIRVTRQASAEMTDECGHPKNEPIHLVVTPISGCEGFEAAA
ncbi:MAG: hypothetical protein AAGF84_01830 [Planctomycetota bacterium]